MAERPDGWAEDMTVPLPPGRTPAEVVEFVLREALRGTPDEPIEQLLAAEFRRSAEDAARARDRSFGGLVRAATRNAGNCPDRGKDPLAWESFQRGTRDPSLVARIYPQFAPGG